MSHILLNRNELRHNVNSNTATFEGYQHGDTSASFFWVDLAPGGGPRLHKHPYEEVFIMLEGRATFTVGSTMIEAAAGQVVIVPPDTPHKFFNSGEEPLKQIDIHSSKQMLTEWLEDQIRSPSN